MIDEPENHTMGLLWEIRNAIAALGEARTMKRHAADVEAAQRFKQPKVEPEPEPREVRAYFKSRREMAASGLHVSPNAEGLRMFERMRKARERYENLGLMGEE
jgi:hypothetical protein